MKFLVEFAKEILQNGGDERVIEEAFNESAEYQGLTGFHYNSLNSQQNVQQLQQLKMAKLQQFKNTVSCDVSSKDDFPII